jgi:AcrR family transcriptional regulator
MAVISVLRRKSPWAGREARTREREVKREAVLRTAVALFNDRGFHATSIDDVAGALSITKPTIYHYFANKDEILFECLRRGIESIQQAGLAAEKKGGPAMERLRAYMREYAIVVTTDFGICVTRTADHELSAAARKRFRASKREIDTAIRRVVEEGMKEGSIAQGDPRLVTFTLTGSLNWIAQWYDPEGELSPEQMADGCVATLVQGLAPRA